MARASVAAALLWAEMTRALGRRFFPSVMEQARGRLASIGPGLSRAIPCMLLLLIASVTVSASLLAMETRRRTLADAKLDLEFISALVDGGINASLASNPGERPQDILERIAPSQAMARQRQLLVSDASGLIVAAVPETDAPSGLLTDWLGAGTHSAELNANGVVKIALRDGREAIAMVGLLQEPLGRIAVIQTLDGALEGWVDATWRWCTYLVAAGCALLAITGAYLYQRMRTNAANEQCRQVSHVIEAALDSGGCGLWDWDFDSGRLEWSDSMFTMLGMPAEQSSVLLEQIEPLLHPDDVPLGKLAQSARGANAIDHALRIRNATGEWRWLRARASVGVRPNGRTHMIGIAVDVTAEKQLARETQTADERLRDAVEAISEAFVVWDADNRLVVWNSKFQHFHNLPAEAMRVGAPYREVVALGAAPPVKNEIAPSARPHREDRTFKAQLADGRWLQVSERRTKDGGYVSVGTDITTLKAHEQGLKLSETRLRDSIEDLKRNRHALEMQTQQLADLAERYFDQKAEAEKANQTKSIFLANMSHQLWTPLNAIIGFSEVMEREMFGRLGSAKYIDYSADIRRSGEYLRDVIADVLEMTSLDAGQVELDIRLLEIGALARSALERIGEAAAEKRLSISHDIAKAIPFYGDPVALRKILAVLLGNAVKFTPSGGRIAVRTRRADGALNLFVADTGVGIARHALDRLGRPFEPICETLADGMKGSGLGLAIATSLTRLHGGRLRIRSQLGVGTVVMLHLPVHFRSAVTSEPSLEAILAG